MELIEGGLYEAVGGPFAGAVYVQSEGRLVSVARDGRLIKGIERSLSELGRVRPVWLVAESALEAVAA